MSYIIENITTKEVTTKFGPKPAYTIVANGERFSYGFKKPVFAIGDEVDFQYTENTYGKNVDMASVQMIKKGTGAPAPAPSTASTRIAPYSPPSKVFPIPLLHGDRAIVRQNSVTNATRAVHEFTTHDTSPYDGTLEEYASEILRIARMFEAYSCGDLDAQAAEAMVA
jgi:hypothetical protein